MTAHIQAFQGGRVHFIGIGGSSMSGLAPLMVKLGYQVTGSDRDRSHKTDALNEKGIPVSVGHKPENVRGADLIVYTAAIAPENPERMEAERLNIPQIERSELIGQLMEGYQNAVAISGTHGKTTTTAMLSQAMVESGVRPTVHIGGELDALGGSTLLGEKDYFGTKTPSYAPATMAVSDAILSRAVMFGLNIKMDDASVEKIITAIKAGARAAL